MARLQEVGQKKAYLNNDLQVVVSSSGSIRTNGNDKNKDDVKVGVQAKKGGGKGREIELTGEREKD